MNFLRKIGTRIWDVKERLVLVAMLLIFGYRVWIILHPEGLDVAPTAHALPRSTPDPSVGPQDPPRKLDLPPPPTEWRPLWREPIWQWSLRRNTGSGADGDSLEGVITVLNIQVTSNGVKRAQLRTRSSKKWYSEGDSFESYQLMEIDEDTGCCSIFSESDRKTIEVCIEE